MKKTLFLLLAILYNTLFGFAQSSVNPKSSTLGLELPKGSKLEKDIAIIKKNSARLDSFAMKHDYKLSKGDAEVFYTDFELLTNTLRENQWVITQEADNEFYQIQKGK